MMDGVVLVGGNSVRMGRDKASLLVAEKTLLHHIITMMRPEVVRLLVVGNQRIVPSVLDDVILVNDIYPGSEGPLSGVLAALQVSSADFLWIMTCDNYGFTSDLLAALLQRLSETGADIAYLNCGGREHPLMAVWRTRVKDDLGDYLQAGGRSVFKWYATQRVEIVTMPMLPQQFCNINTPEDYQALLDAVC